MAKPTWLNVLQSVLWGFFGVQKSENRERDFSSGNIFPFIVVGAVLTLLFILSLVAVVKYVTA